MVRNRLVLGLVAVLLAFAGASGTMGAGVSHAAVAACGSLSLGTGAPTGSSELTAASFSSAGQLWAVGDVYNAPLRANRTLIERFDGSRWSLVSSPNQGAKTNGLNSVSMLPGGGWAVGYAIEAGAYQPLALRWNGSAWSLASPTKLTGDAYFTSVDTLADGTAWAAGFQTSAGTSRTLIERASGGTWALVASPNDGADSADNTLMAVGGTRATGLWAVGYWLSRTGLRPLVLRYDMALSSPSWVSVSGTGGVPSPGKIDTVLTGVDVRTAADVWAVGYYNNGSVLRPLALHWNGSVWSNSPVPGAGLLRKVRAIGPSDVWAAGTYYSMSEHRTKTLVVHFDGTAWTTVKSADSSSRQGDALIGLATNKTGSMITVVGSQGPRPLIEQANCPTGPVSLSVRAAAPVSPAPAVPGIGPAPSPPKPTPPPMTPVPVTVIDRAAAAGLAGAPDVTWSAAVADFNADGWPDLLVVQHGNPAYLWLNNHDGTFTQANVGLAGSVDRHDCLAADFNRDGLPDVFCSVGADHGTALKSNELYLQQPDGMFADRAYQWYVSDLTGRGRYSAVLDANNDGYPDIFSGTASLRADGLPSLDRFYLDTGHGSFIDAPAMGLDLSIGSKCAHTVDYNSDGWLDLLVCIPGGLHLFRNDQGHGFTDVSSLLGARVNAGDALMADVNHDSRPDLITLTPATVTERLQRAGGTFGPPRTLLTVQNGVSLAVGDVNGDHNPDIYVVCGRAGNVNAPDDLLIGNATGGFATMPIPQATTGAGDRAYPVDYNHSGLTSFLVLNGSGEAGGDPGPIQLLTPVP
jgi:VCBS repeat protein